ncbi:MAG: alpha-L-fucosidase, partial [Mariniphaga sp.]
HKRIQKITPIEVSAVRLRIVKSVGEPIIRKLAVYNTIVPEKDIFGNIITPKTAAQEQAIKARLKTETPKEREERMRWFTEGRFGMFIHWGVYSVPAGAYGDKKGCGEWLMESAQIPVSKYEQFAQQFNPVKFDAKEWVRIAKDAGMKYIVITAKHHDGFSMYRSDLTDWGIKATPFQRDPLKELAEACKEADIKLCFYYSIMDWHHADWPERRPWNDSAKGIPDMNRYTEFMKGQLTELLTRYGPIGILWFDGDSEKPWKQEAGFDLYYYLRSIQPNLIINNRIAKARDIKTENPAAGDFGTPEQRIPKQGQVPILPWESCMTINETWGFDKSDHEFKSSRTLVRNLVDCAGKGGNYLLNVGPTAEGLIPDKSVERLREVGEWMKINGEAIYGTVSAKLEGLPSGCLATQKGNKVYLHLFEWPEKIFVPLNRQVKSAFLIANPKLKVAIKTGQNGIGITLPKENPGKIATVICLETGEVVSKTDTQPINKTASAKDNVLTGTIWRSEQPADCPFPQSESIGSVLFTGRHAEYTSADTWYPSWASDGNLYSPWTDGNVNGLGVFSGGPNAATGNATITGDDPLNLKVADQVIFKSDPRPYGGRYPCGSLVHNGVWYYGTYCLAESGSGLNWDILGPFVGFRYSTDFGKTWNQTPCTPEKPLFPEPTKFKGPVRFGSPHFVDFGKNMEYSTDGKAYLVGHGATIDDPKPREAANASWITGDQIFLTRVKPTIKNINNVGKYEFFAGNTTAGKPIWTSDFSKIKPIADWNNNMGCVTITYNAPLKKYLMCVTDGVNTVTKYNTYILESSSLTGPWKMVTYLKSFGEVGYFVNIPSKFISADGRTMWLCYSANWMDQKNKRYHAIPDGSRYGMCLQEIKLLE